MTSFEKIENQEVVPTKMVRQATRNGFISGNHSHKDSFRADTK